MEQANSVVQVESTPPTAAGTDCPAPDAEPDQADAPTRRGMEQLRYWERDLFYKKLNLLISCGGFLLITLGLFANYWQISINSEQLRINTAQSDKVAKSIRANVENAIVTHITTLDRVFMDRPDLLPYFLEGKSIDKNDQKYLEVSAAAFLILDICDLIATQNSRYPEFRDTPEIWDSWIKDIFSTSPILRDTFDEYPSWYGNSLKELRRKGQEKLESSAAQKSER